MKLAPEASLVPPVPTALPVSKVQLVPMGSLVRKVHKVSMVRLVLKGLPVLAFKPLSSMPTVNSSSPCLTDKRLTRAHP